MITRENGQFLITAQSSGRAILRIYTMKNPQTDRNSSFSSMDFQQLRLWLLNCDKHHPGCTKNRHDRKPAESVLPTRLLCVDPSRDPNDVRLDIAGKVKGDRYLALSHCWGLSKGDPAPTWRTLQENIQSRMNGFKLDELPKTFQHAVEVTRKLGLSYIWIDSICIIQGEDGDWKQESKRMEDIYALAYCTIAATSAKDSSAGFLEEREDNESLYIRDEQGQAIYISTNVADFDTDIGVAVLNRRAWVMQERFLSSRTIHFTRTQIYGECGEGVYAGDGIFLRR
jgi:hypothetical protein